MNFMIIIQSIIYLYNRDDNIINNNIENNSITENAYIIIIYSVQKNNRSTISKKLSSPNKSVNEIRKSIISNSGKAIKISKSNLSSNNRNLSLNKILEDPELVHGFQIYLKNMFDPKIKESEDFLIYLNCFNFWLEVEDYKALPSCDFRTSKANEIFNRYINFTAPLPVF